MSSSSALQSRVLALLLKGWIEKYNRPAVKFTYLVELVRALRHLVQRANIMINHDDLTAMVFINAERFIVSSGCIEHTLHTILFTSFGITAKCCEDDRLFNTHIAQACGMKLEHLNKMECLFLTQLKFDVILSPEQVIEFYADAKKRFIGRPSITVQHAPFVSRLVNSLLHHSNKDASTSSSSSKYPHPSTTARTVSTPALFQTPPPTRHTITISPSSSSSSSSPSAALQRVTPSRTVSTPNFSPKSPLSTPATTTTTTKTTSSHKSVLASKSISVSTKQRIEKASSRLINFFRSRDE